MSQLLQEKKIVVIEDDTLTSQSLSDFFSDANEVSTFPSSEALLETLPNLGSVDIFIIDYRLPGMDGIELFHKLKLEQTGAKYICISGEMSMELASQINDIGFDALILKPFDFAILEKNIAALIEA